MIIPILGCPGSGKTTVIKRLAEGHGCPGFEMSWMPEFRFMNGEKIDYETDERIAVGAIVKLAAEYVRSGHRRVFVSDFRNQVIPLLLECLTEHEAMVVVLIFSDESMIRDRVLDPERPSGYRNVEASVSANRWLKSQKIPGALEVDVSNSDVEAVLNAIDGACTLPNKSNQRDPPGRAPATERKAQESEKDGR